MTATTVRPALRAPAEPAPLLGATVRERVLAVGLWAVVVAALGFGVVATVIKAGGLVGA